ncbi:syntaxin 18 [Guillardia theta CCMP2712]|uniref:Syntaxin 18 n=1 Tax=Guillardia theta (strain CCMP2712) TaxID=905079 RepID=L1J4H0_GUITC|nr:syntaxin 18 [Guillardia theta CCMP2712]EKX43222.1 syntaxin 18 [Guillardia theta CCMP2712]|eukprot:XP_005830202.1 syntaxin 18 [Guillardia theta CCMP2712]
MDRTAEWLNALRQLRGDSKQVITPGLIPRKKQEGSASESARVIMAGIRKTHNLLQESKEAYFAVRGGMDDSDRDELDRTVKGFLTESSSDVDELRRRMKELLRGLNTDQQAHQQGMILVLLEGYEALSEKFRQFKSHRMEMAKMESKNVILGSAAVSSSRGICTDPPRGAICDLELTPEEQEMLKEENERLQEELDSELEQMVRMEGEIAKVTAMCEVASQKIMEQATEIDALYENVVHAVEDIDAGNIQLQKASEATVFSRFFMLIFLLLASFILLFLHWYMD